MIRFKVGVQGEIVKLLELTETARRFEMKPIGLAASG